VFFLHFKEHTLEGGWGVKMGQNENYTAFFALIEDFGCSFKLNFDGRGGQKW
jgi:hypothetical protein